MPSAWTPGYLGTLYIFVGFIEEGVRAITQHADPLRVGGEAARTLSVGQQGVPITGKVGWGPKDGGGSLTPLYN